ncbi:MAG: hypothetical protein ACLRRR_12095 [Agathobacter rectalis]
MESKWVDVFYATADNTVITDKAGYLLPFYMIVWRDTLLVEDSR